MSPRPGHRVLVAGIGNIFLGDDGFGVEVISRLGTVAIPGVDVADYGIRGVHLAYELLEGRHDTLIFVHALPLGEPPGTLAVLEVPSTEGESDELAGTTVDAHAMSPAVVLRVLRGLGGRVGRVLVVGCQPAAVTEGIGLSGPVRDALGAAARLVRQTAHAEARRLGHAGAGQAGAGQAGAGQAEVG